MLETIDLPGGGRRTTRLGFGCSGLMGGLSERDSLHLLETAFEEGIRHFDVAPSYGHGAAERCLGKFLQGKMELATVTTKYGILPPQHAGLTSAARAVLRPVTRRLPQVRARLAKTANKLNTKARFNAEEARLSLDQSLHELGLDRVDLWLLHEPSPKDLGSDDLLTTLREMQGGGRIGAFGVGAERGRVDALWHRHPEYCRVLQFESSILSPQPDYPGAFRILYRTVSGALETVRTALHDDPERARRWSDRVDADLRNEEILGGLLLQVSLLLNPGGIILFSSRNPSHIRTNTRMAGETGLNERAREFLTLIEIPGDNWRSSSG